jgi:hypothetical protein
MRGAASVATDQRGMVRRLFGASGYRRLDFPQDCFCLLRFQCNVRHLVLPGLHLLLHADHHTIAGCRSRRPTGKRGESFLRCVRRKIQVR